MSHSAPDNRGFAGALTGALAAASLIAGCSPGGGVNSTLNSVHQPVVERTTYSLDLATIAGTLPEAEQVRLGDWFTALGLGYADRIALSGASGSGSVRADIAALAGRFGVLMSEPSSAPGSPAEPGLIRVSVTRSHAFVPGCPDWSGKSAANLGNATSSSFGCAVNGNLAAMVADPEHLLRGAEGSGATVAMSAAKAIATYRDQEPTGAAGLAELSSRGDDQ